MIGIPKNSINKHNMESTSCIVCITYWPENSSQIFTYMIRKKPKQCMPFLFFWVIRIPEEELFLHYFSYGPMDMTLSLNIRVITRSGISNSGRCLNIALVHPWLQPTIASQHLVKHYKSTQYYKQYTNIVSMIYKCLIQKTIK